MLYASKGRLSKWTHWIILWKTGCQLLPTGILGAFLALTAELAGAFPRDTKPEVLTIPMPSGSDNTVDASQPANSMALKHTKMSSQSLNPRV